MVISKPIKEAILRQATTPELREIAVKEGFQTMLYKDMGRRLIANGELSFREFERVLSSSQKIYRSMEAFTYKGISEGKYVEGEIEALNQDEASFKLKEQKVIITNLIKSAKKKAVKKKSKKQRLFIIW